MKRSDLLEVEKEHGKTLVDKFWKHERLNVKGKGSHKPSKARVIREARRWCEEEAKSKASMGESGDEDDASERRQEGKFY